MKTAVQRVFDGCLYEVALAKDLEAIDAVIVETMQRVFPCEIVSWNYSRDAGVLERASFTPTYTEVFVGGHEALLAWLPIHPLYTERGFSGFDAAQRLSGLQPQWMFQQSALWYECYRHLDTNYQAFTGAGVLNEYWVLRSLNRKYRDFNDDEVAMVQKLGHDLRPILREVDQRFRHAKKASEIEGLVTQITGFSGLEQLTPREIDAAAALLEHGTLAGAAMALGIRPHTLSRCLADVAEKVGAENTRTLMAGFWAVQQAAHGNPQEGIA